MFGGELANSRRDGLPDTLPSQNVLVTSPVLLVDSVALDALSGGALKPPLVSFILINWNYGRFVGDAIDSIRAQDYSNFECLIVDNGSTDGSREVYARHVQDDPRFSIECLPENIGQLGAAIWALGRTSGNFVTFVDADDILFPGFASAHLQVHFALPRSVALTSSNVIEFGEAGRVATGGYLYFSRINVGQSKIRGLRSADTTVRFSAITEEVFEKLSRTTAVVDQSEGGWLWSPGSSNMFRRSILKLASFDGHEQGLMRTADGHFNPLCHALGGSALIDLPLSAYRQHGQNYYSVGETVPGVRQGTAAYLAKAEGDYRQTVELLLDRTESFSWLLSDRFWPTVDRLTRVPSSELKKYYSKPATQQVFARHISKLHRQFGDAAVIDHIRERFRVGPAWRIFKNGLTGGISFSFWRLFWATELNRFLSRQKSRRKRRRD